MKQDHAAFVCGSRQRTAVVQGRPVVLYTSSYTGVPGDPAIDPAVESSPEALEQFLAGEGGPLGVARYQVNGVFAEPISAYRTSSFFAFLVRTFLSSAVPHVFCANENAQCTSNKICWQRRCCWLLSLWSSSPNCRILGIKIHGSLDMDAC
jgi:hypothetical protein